MDSEGLSDEGDTPAGDAADFYQEMFNGTEICTAFARAKHGVGF